jgi:hypothetical protein
VVLHACTVRGLQPVALKGIHLAALVYAQPALRPMNDIDLLFTPAELPGAEALLQELGYDARHKPAEIGARVTKHTSTFRRPAQELTPARPAFSGQTATPNPYLSARQDRTVEPHSSLEESWYGLTVDITGGVRERAVMAELAGWPCRVLAREDLLLHVCVHFTFHLIMAAPALVQLTDILAITQAGGLNWPTFLQRAQECLATGFVLAALTLAHKLLDAPIPPEILEALAATTPRDLRLRVSQLDLAYVLRRTQQAPLTSLPQRLRRGMQDRLEIARWAPTLSGKLRVWQTAVQFSRTDTGQLLLRPFHNQKTS